MTILPGTLSWPGAWWPAASALLGLLLGAGLLLMARRQVAPTTLVPAWWWSLAALLAWSAVEIAAPLSAAGETWLAPLRLAAVALSFCPVVALVGAKRPQHAAWSFVVLSLWSILALPAAENLLLQRGQRLEMGDARGWFLWMLIALGPINFVPTRYALAAILMAAGQILALSPNLPLLRQPLVEHAELAGLGLCVVAIAAARWAWSRHRPSRHPYDRLWLDFRDTFGLFWSLRVQERVNAAAKQEHWGLELGWNGFHRAADGAPLEAIDPAIEPALRTTFKGLLRRFVSNAWIAERLGRSLD